MKKIGILFGQESSFPQAFVDRVNEKNIKGISAEFVTVDEVFQGRATDYAVIIDRISQDVPFYRAYLKNAAISGTAVMNNPFWWSADEKFFNNALATKLGVPVPKTYLLPSKEMPTDTSSNSFKNLKFPMNWSNIFDEIGFPAYMKPHSGGGWKSVYKVTDVENLFQSYSETGQLVMLLQEEIQFESYFRCYCLGQKYVRIMQYEPRNPHHLRYVTNGGPVEKKLLKTIEDYVFKLNNALGYDMNTVEFAVRDGIPYAIDFCNPAPDADLFSVGQENFDWVVENAANMAIERAQSHKDGKDNLTWGNFIKTSVAGEQIGGGKTSAPAVEKSVGKRGPKPKATAAKSSSEVKVAGKRGPKPKAASAVAPKVAGKRGPKPKATAANASTEVKVAGKRGPKPKATAAVAPKVAGKRGPKPKASAANASTEVKVAGKRGPKPKATVAAAPKVAGQRGPKPKASAANASTEVKVAGKRGPKPKATVAAAPKVAGKRGPKPKTSVANASTEVKVAGKRGPKPKAASAAAPKLAGKRGPKPKASAANASAEVKVAGKRGPKPKTEGAKPAKIAKATKAIKAPKKVAAKKASPKKSSAKKGSAKPKGNSAPSSDMNNIGE